MTNTEVWKPILEAPGYEVSNLGRVASWLPERNFSKPPVVRRILKPGIDKDGYKKVVLRKEGARLYRRVCVLVATAWHGKRQIGMVVRHLDGTKANDVPENLKWGTPKENSEDSRHHGTWVHGESVNTAKLSAANVAEILLSEKGHSELARVFGVTPGAIWHIRSKRSWKNVSAK